MRVSGLLLENYRLVMICLAAQQVPTTAMEAPADMIAPIRADSALLRWASLKILRQHIQGSRTEAVVLRRAPVRAMRQPKKGSVRAATAVLSTRRVLMRTLTDLEPEAWKWSSMAAATGASMRAYLVSGLTTVVQMASFELSFWAGRLRVI